MQTPTDVQIIEAARRAIGAGPAAQGKLLEITMSREALLSFARELLRASALSYTGPDKGEAKCAMCNGHGLVGGFENSGAPGYTADECPDCHGSGKAAPSSPSNAGERE